MRTSTRPTRVRSLRPRRRRRRSCKKRHIDLSPSRYTQKETHDAQHTYYISSTNTLLCLTTLTLIILNNFLFSFFVIIQHLFVFCFFSFFVSFSTLNYNQKIGLLLINSTTSFIRQIVFFFFCLSISYYRCKNLLLFILTSTSTYIYFIRRFIFIFVFWKFNKILF